MQEDNSFFDLNDKQLEGIQDKYALLEPLLDTYLSESEKREYSTQVCTKLGISPRMVFHRGLSDDTFRDSGKKEHTLLLARNAQMLVP